MEKLLNNCKNKTSREVGDTIVEVLISIAVASFTIGTSYAIATKSLQSAINARERNEALNLVQNQITDLKNRYNNTFVNNNAQWNQYFIADNTVSGPPFPASKLHFCLIDNPIGPLDPTWLPQKNSITSEAAAETLSVPPYNDNAGTTCVRKLTTNYYIDISAEVTSATAALPVNDRTVYKVSVRWSPVGGQSNQKAEVFYRF